MYFIGLEATAARAWDTTLSSCGRIQLMLVVDGLSFRYGICSGHHWHIKINNYWIPDFSIADSPPTMRTSWFATTAPQLTSISSLSTTLPTTLATAHASAATPRLECALWTVSVHKFGGLNIPPDVTFLRLFSKVEYQLQVPKPD